VAKWITFNFIGNSKSGKTKIWDVRTLEGYTLGYIKWDAPWRKYSFCPLPNTSYESDCLQDLSDFCKKVTIEHKALSSKATYEQEAAL